MGGEPVGGESDFRQGKAGLSLRIVRSNTDSRSQKKKRAGNAARCRPCSVGCGELGRGGGRGGSGLRGNKREVAPLKRVLQARPPVQAFAEAPAAIQVTQHGFG